MNTSPSSLPGRPAESGMATFIVIVLLALMTALVLANQGILRQWDQHLRALEGRQLANPPLVIPIQIASPTNPPPATAGRPWTTPPKA
jgi:hypothetical protein